MLILNDLAAPEVAALLQLRGALEEHLNDVVSIATDETVMVYSLYGDGAPLPTEDQLNKLISSLRRLKRTIYGAGGYNAPQ